MKPKDNLLAIFEEIGGNIDGVQIVTVNRNTICSYIKESDPPRVNNRKREDSVIQKVFDDARRSATLMCPDNRKILRVEFASYGNPFGACGNYTLGNCSASSSKRIIEQVYYLSLIWAHRHFHFTAFGLIGFSHYRACSTAWEKTDVQYHLTRIFSTGRESFVRMLLKIWLSRYNVVRINRVPSKNP